MRFLNVRSYLKAESGIAAIEFALIMPLLLFMFLGLVELTDAISSNRRITSVANSIGDLVTQNRGSVLKADIQDYLKISALIMKPKSDSGVRVRVSGWRSNGTSLSQTWSVDNLKGSCNFSMIDEAKIKSLMSSGNDIIVTQACMKYDSFVAGITLGRDQVNDVGKVGASGVKAYFSNIGVIQQTIMMRPRASAKLECYTVASGAGGTPC